MGLTKMYRYIFQLFIALNGVGSSLCSVQDRRKIMCEPWPANTTTPAVLRGDICFFRSEPDQTYTWQDASTYCSEYDGKMYLLANSSDPVYYLRLPDWPSKEGCGWIGLRKENGKWRWKDGSLFDDDRFNLAQKFSHFFFRNRECGKVCWRDSGWGPGFGPRGHYIDTVKCTERLMAMCQYDPVISNKLPLASNKSTVTENGKRVTHPVISDGSPSASATSTATQEVKRRNRYVVVEIATKKNLRLTTPPDWSIQARTVTSCARQCHDLHPRCLLFNFHCKTQTCNIFSSGKFEAIGADDWTLWKSVENVQY